MVERKYQPPDVTQWDLEPDEEDVVHADTTEDSDDTDRSDDASDQS